MGQTIASEIAETLLDQTGRGLLRSCFDTFMDAFALPYTHTNFGKTVKVTTKGEMQSLFNQALAHNRSIGLDRLVRYVIAADWTGPDEILSTHETHFFHGDYRLQPPFPVLSTLKKIDGDWKITAANYAVGEDQPYATALELRHQAQ